MWYFLQLLPSPLFWCMNLRCLESDESCKMAPKLDVTLLVCLRQPRSSETVSKPRCGAFFAWVLKLYLHSSMGSKGFLTGLADP